VFNALVGGEPLIQKCEILPQETRDVVLWYGGAEDMSMSLTVHA